MIKFGYFNIINEYISKVIKLKNGGYVIGYITTIGDT